MNPRETVTNQQPNIWKGAVDGAIGGIIASWVMEEFQSAWLKVTTSTQSQNGSNSVEKSAEQEPATVKAAAIVSEKLFGHHLEKSEKGWAGNAVHYTTGGTSGAAYGIAAELAPQVTAGAGLPFGTAVWLAIDEGAVPLLGLSKGPTEYPVSTHIYALASHFVYGLTTEITRRTLRKSVLS